MRQLEKCTTPYILEVIIKDPSANIIFWYYTLVPLENKHITAYLIQIYALAKDESNCVTPIRTVFATDDAYNMYPLNKYNRWQLCLKLASDILTTSMQYVEHVRIHYTITTIKQILLDMRATAKYDNTYQFSLEII